MTRPVEVFPEPEALAQRAAALVDETVARARSERGRAMVALSGGGTPKRTYQLLAERGTLAGDDVGIFFVDERCVPPTDERSNYRLAKEHLLDPLGIPAENVFRMRGEEEPIRAADDYEAVLRREFARVDHLPQFDFVLLGLGPDGHTASLFPETCAVEETRRWVAANHVPKLNEWRLTLTLPVLNAARRAVFLVVGTGKRDAVAAVLRPEKASPVLPASLVRPDHGSLVWIVDEGAAASL